MKSSSHQLTRTLRSVEVLRSLSLNQLQRLEELLTEASYSDGEYVIRQGERTDTFYVILEGSVAVTRSDDPSDAGAAEKELSTFSSGYFGERALIEKAPRAANVIARGPLRCLCVGRDGFEEVLGPLQSIIDADRRRRERISEQRLLQREAQGLASVRRGDFVMYALAGGECCELALATHAPSGGEYTLRGYSKARVQSAGMAERVMSEAALLAGIATASPFVPLALTHFQDESHLFTVFSEYHDVVQLLADFFGAANEMRAAPDDGRKNAKEGRSVDATLQPTQQPRKQLASTIGVRRGKCSKVPPFDDDAHGSPAAWDDPSATVCWGKHARRMFEDLPAGRPDIEGPLTFLDLRRGPDQASVTYRLGSPESEPGGRLRLPWLPLSCAMKRRRGCQGLAADMAWLPHGGGLLRPLPRPALRGPDCSGPGCPSAPCPGWRSSR